MIVLGRDFATKEGYWWTRLTSGCGYLVWWSVRRSKTEWNCLLVNVSNAANSHVEIQDRSWYSAVWSVHFTDLHLPDSSPAKERNISWRREVIEEVRYFCMMKFAEVENGAMVLVNVSNAANSQGEVQRRFHKLNVFLFDVRWLLNRKKVSRKEPEELMLKCVNIQGFVQLLLPGNFFLTFKFVLAIAIAVLILWIVSLQRRILWKGDLMDIMEIKDQKREKDDASGLLLHVPLVRIRIIMTSRLLTVVMLSFEWLVTIKYELSRERLLYATHECISFTCNLYKYVDFSNIWYNVVKWLLVQYADDYWIFTKVIRLVSLVFTPLLRSGVVIVLGRDFATKEGYWWTRLTSGCGYLVWWSVRRSKTEWNCLLVNVSNAANSHVEIQDRSWYSAVWSVHFTDLHLPDSSPAKERNISWRREVIEEVRYFCMMKFAEVENGAMVLVNVSNAANSQGEVHWMFHNLKVSYSMSGGCWIVKSLTERTRGADVKMRKYTGTRPVTPAWKTFNF